MTCIAIGLPITALSVQRNFILAGEGPYLHVYDQSVEQSPRISCKVLHHQVIHGIQKGPGSVFAVFGQKALNFIRINQNKSISVLSGVHEVIDWIWDVCWLQARTASDVSNDPACSDLPTKDGWREGEDGCASDGAICNTCVAIATGHNAVLLWDVEKMGVVSTVHCQENCILYSAKFIGNTWDDLVLAAGTVFNQVVLWSPRGSKDASGRVVVDHRFKGHQGVIFNITYNADLALLATVSDDRSIRLWRYHHPLRKAGALPQQAECVLYGHSARVWSAEILNDMIVSVGEDATCCIWNLNGEIVKKLKSHKGKSIWSLAVERNGSFIVTGGGDSSIRRWSLQSKQPASETTPSNWNIQRDLKALLEGKSEVSSVVEADLVPRTLTISSDGQLLVMTQGGYLFSWSNVSSSYRLVNHDERYRSYSVLASAPSSPMVALGNIHGSIKVIPVDQHSTSGSEIKAYDGNIVNLTWATDEDLFSTGMEGHLTWWKVRSNSSITMLAHAQFTLPPCRQRWATSVTILGEDRFVCGDRRGSVHLFERSPSQNDRAGPKSSVPGVHGKAGTSFVCLHNGSVYSAGRDGTYRRYYISDEGQIRLENTHKVYKGFDWLEKLVFTEDGDIHVLGFHSVNFVVWSTLNNEALLTVPCGGGHRAWDLSPLDDGTMTFVCIKMKQLLVHTASAISWQRQTILKEDIHGREITCIQYLRTLQLSGQDHHICATGSEDTKVNIISFSSPQSKMNSSPCSIPLLDIAVLHRLHAHVSSVRALASCLSKSADDVLLFSVGGRYSINCWKVKFSGEVSSVISVKQICTVRHLISHSSLTTTRSKRKLRQSEKLLDPETRFMGVSVWRKGDAEGVATCETDHVMVCVASSDALIRIFCFDEGTCKIVPLGSSNIHDCCLLCVTSSSLTFDHKVEARTKSGTAVWTGGTDGCIVVQDVKEFETLADKLTRNASVCESEGEEDKYDYYCEEEKMVFGASVQNQDKNTLGGIEEPKEMDMREIREIRTMEACLQQTTCNVQDNTACCEARTTSVCKSGASQSAINLDATQSDIHKTSTVQMRGRESGARGGEVLQSDSSDAVRTKSFSDPGGHSAKSILTGTSLPYDVGDCIPSNKASFSQLVHRWSAHQSGINALAVHHITDDRWVVASGGDDNAITVTLLRIGSSVGHEASGMTGAVLDMVTISTAHAAQVTGIRFISPDHTFLSVSVDQRLNRWSLELSKDFLKIKEVRMMSSSFIHVSDVAGLDTWGNRSTDELYAVVCGQGLQLISVSR